MYHADFLKQHEQHMTEIIKIACPGDDRSLPAKPPRVGA
jgi:hypothetical protein